MKGNDPCRHNQALEQDSMTMHEEKLMLEHEAELLSKRLAAVMKDKQEPHSTEFDAETPIDKVLNVMQSYIEKVRPCTVCHLMSCSSRPTYYYTYFAVTWTCLLWPSDVFWLPGGCQQYLCKALHSCAYGHAEYQLSVKAGSQLQQSVTYLY